jgi:hypothetical protein
MSNKNVKTIGSKGVVADPTKLELDTSNLTEEEKQKAVENIRYQARKIIRQSLSTQFKQVYTKILKGMTLQEVIQEVKDKKSNLTKSARDFVLNFKEEVIQEWIDDIQNPDRHKQKTTETETINEPIKESKNEQE